MYQKSLKPALKPVFRYKRNIEFMFVCCGAQKSFEVGKNGINIGITDFWYSNIFWYVDCGTT